jgi:WD40 repeat protein
MDLKCHFCKNDYQSTPIFLPCGWTVCQIHLENNDLKECVFCTESHRKNDGKSYPVNKPADIHFNKCRLEESIQKASEKLEGLKLVQTDPYNFFYEYFEKLLNKVHIREGEVLESIKSHFDTVIHEIKEIRDKYKPLEQDKYQSVVDFKNENLELLENELKEIIEFNKPQINGSSLIDFDKKLKENRKRIEQIEKIFDQKVDSLMDNTTYELSPIEECDYGKLFGKLTIQKKQPKPVIEIGTCLKTLTGHSDTVSSLLLTQNGELISGSCDKRIKIWDMNTEKCIKTISGNQKAIYALAINRRGQVISGSMNNSIKVWDLESGVCVQTLRGHEDWTNALVFSEDNDLLISGSNDSTIKIWDFNTGRCLKTLIGHSNDVIKMT